MNLLLVLLLAAGDEPVITVHTVAMPPKIDGVLEPLWQQADSAWGFTQASPDEGRPATEPTTAYVLQDAANLYVGFRCRSDQHRPVAALYGIEEEVTVYIDPMDSRNFGYFFKVYGSGLFRSGKVLDDGTSQDWSWDAVWYQAIKLHDDYFEVEVRIPFKSIRYKEDAAEWGINFDRVLPYTQEYDAWTKVRHSEGGNLVSKYGRLQGINPRAQGYYFELYPEGFVRYDQGSTGAGEFKPRASLNFKWDLTPQTTLNSTVLPDFAQIESDPYSFNLSRYPTFFGEQRPFFIEGSEVFRLSGLGDGIFAPLRTFYSRRIGKAVAGEPVPIITGAKLTTKADDWSFGALGAYTDRLMDSTLELEPRRGFAVISGRTNLPDTSSLGALFSGTVAGAENHNCALTLDWNRSAGPNRAAMQAALSERNGKFGWAVNSGFQAMTRKWITLGVLEMVDDSFDVTDIGYVPWAGRKRLQVMSGPSLRWSDRAITRLTAGPGISITQEPGSRDFSYWATVYANPQFRNGYGFNVEGSIGSASEADTTYFGRSASLSAWATGLKYNVNFGLGNSRSINYRRGYLADNYNDWFSINYYLFTRIALMLSGNNYWEMDPAGQVAGVTSILRPKIDFRIDSKMTFNVYDELVLATPESRFGETQLATNRVGFLYSWNFLPKSWLYVAFNDFRLDAGEGLQLADRVGAVKVRYLFYF